MRSVLFKSMQALPSISQNADLSNTDAQGDDVSDSYQ